MAATNPFNVLDHDRWTFHLKCMALSPRMGQFLHQVPCSDDITGPDMKSRPDIYMYGFASPIFIIPFVFQALDSEAYGGCLF